MTTIRRISPREIKSAVSSGRATEATPTGLPPILRASWNFARNTARRFSQELLKDRAAEFLDKLRKRFA